MPIKYEIQQLENAGGSGESRPFVRLHQGRAMSGDELGRMIAASSTLTPADVKAVMSELCHYAKQELRSGHRFYLPEIGYLSLSVGRATAHRLCQGKIDGRDIFVRNVDFKPEARFLADVRRGVRFEKSHFSTKSVRYSPMELWSQVEAYLVNNHFITSRLMSLRFGLSKYMAQRWLRRFTAEGRLIKDGTPHNIIYFRA